MPYTRKSYKKRPSYTMRRRTYKKRSATMYRAVNRVLAKTSEIKFRPINVSNFSLYGDEIYALNPAYHIPIGNTGDQRNGIKIQNGMLYFRGFYKHTGIQAGATGPTYPWDSSYLRVIAFYTNKEWHNSAETAASDLVTGGVGSNVNTFEILYNYVPGKNAFGFTNRKDIKVVLDKRIRASYRSPHKDTEVVGADPTPKQAGVKYFKFRVKLGNLTYQNSSTNAYPRFRQLIIAFMTGCPSPAPISVDEVGQVELQYAVKFNDF